jgi:hypothetical protein
MSAFAIVRLGKDSVTDIRTLDALRASPVTPVKFSVRCSQVPQELNPGDYVFMCLGSDNNKGIPTAWTRGVRALGTVTAKGGGPGYNDPWDVAVEIKVVLPESVTQKDLLAKAPTAYYWCSDIPVLGVDTHSNQTVQIIKDQDSHQNVGALVYALTSIFPAFRADSISAYPGLASLFGYRPPPPGLGSGSVKIAEPLLQDATLHEIVERFSVDSGTAGLRVRGQDARRLIACLLSKRFLIATGLAGSGKTKLAQAFARWITPGALPVDPFVPGSTLMGAQSEYTVMESNAGSVTLASADGKLAPLPRAIIEEWADYIERNGVPESISGRELRDKIEAESKVTGYLHRLESHYKPAAFALVAARKDGHPLKCYEVIPVGADWTGNENVLGYPNGLDKQSYLAKPALNLALQAAAYPEIPHFLILDEMNLSHVERYFADILSAIESGEAIPLHEDSERKAGERRIPSRMELPKNLFIVGTVNVDETTYMFSPKVLDRANVIEFRMDAGELKAFLGNPAKPDLDGLDGKGAGFGTAFALAAGSPVDVPEEVKLAFENEMTLFFSALQEHGAEFGYRVAHEAARFMHFYKVIGNHPDGDASWFRAAFDSVIVQKLLPKLHGSRAKLGPLLKKLWFLCVNDFPARGSELLNAAEDAARSTDRKAEPSTAPESLTAAPYPLSAEKIARMWRLLNENGFASFAEA